MAMEAGMGGGDERRNGSGSQACTQRDCMHMGIDGAKRDPYQQLVTEKHQHIPGVRGLSRRAGCDSEVSAEQRVCRVYNDNFFWRVTG
jgi:hypothetical protein